MLSGTGQASQGKIHLTLVSWDGSRGGPALNGDGRWRGIEMIESDGQHAMARARGDLLDAAEAVAVRRVVANNPNTPVPILTRLAADLDFCVRRCVAENPRSPEEVLRRLADDSSSDVRLALAENPNTPAAMLSELAQDRNPDVRFGVAENPRIPPFILKFLSRDENPYISCRAMKTLHMVCPQESVLIRELFEQVTDGIEKTDRPAN